MSRPQCLKNPPTLNSASGAGDLQDIGGLNSYVTGSVDSKLAILLISDVFGYEAPLLRKIADKVAAAGYLVVVPDFFYGEPLDREKHNVQTWLKDHGADKGCEDAKAVVESLKSKGVSSIGAAGFCWGGMVVSKLAKHENSIGAAVILHPGPITVDEINEVKVPTAILAAEHDHIFPPDQAKQLTDALSAKSEIESCVKIFPGVEHGWTVRYNVEDESAVKAAEEAHSDMLNWFTKFIN
ncbi:endo-1,3;1,4-beta-D-glucanase [Nicotiana tabacum]|uniref:Endo-1,31,4-beta-D-glucanase n=1 Tax=Nicotiana tabacum TaxID=4097 RepID=A0A1S4DFY0_TOBAC|nr:endo-1,3;1,4-beta-D-glucanase-like [Nicotiana tomentosiformis]XP_016512372.1 PREDICTED: endo-1,3;1,4-beta-D-glucanase-like [Nicotiana tabacum]